MKFHTSKQTGIIVYFISILITKFLTISKDFRRFSECFLKVTRTFPNTFRNFAKIIERFRRFLRFAEDFRGRPEDVSTVHQQI